MALGAKVRPTSSKVSDDTSFRERIRLPATVLVAHCGAKVLVADGLHLPFCLRAPLIQLLCLIKRVLCDVGELVDAEPTTPIKVA